MANTFDKLAEYTVGSGGSATVSFTNILSGYKDLVVYASIRQSSSSNNAYFTINAQYATGNYTDQGIYAYPATPTIGSYEHTSAGAFQINTNNSSSTTGHFTPARFYFPNAQGSGLKAVFMESGQIWASSSAYGFFGAGANTGVTSTISSIEFRADAGTWVQYSYFTLYGTKSS